jgi:hypothetical protein
MNPIIGDITLQNAVFFSAVLQSAFQSNSRIFQRINVENVGLNETYTGQVLEKIESNLVAESARPIFNTPQIKVFSQKMSIYEAPYFVSDTSISQVRFSAMTIGKCAQNIGMALGRQADRVVINALNVGYDREDSIILPSGSPLDVEAISEARSKLGFNNALGELKMILDFDSYSNLLLDERFSRWNYNEARPLTDSRGIQDWFITNYQGIEMIRVGEGIALPLADENNIRLFIFSSESVLGLIGLVNPYGLGLGTGGAQQWHCYRGGWDINHRIRLSALTIHPKGVLAVECLRGLKPRR